MKILYITTIGATMDFFISLIEELVSCGQQVDIACSNIARVDSVYKELGCNIYELSCSRSPLNKGNIKCISEIKEIVKNNNYDIVHCHTPIAAACTRLACKDLRKKDLREIYTAHGFHFYKGAPLKNWIIYYPIEKICSYWTDTLITINKEDYELAKRKFKVKKVEYVPGVGIDVDKFKNTAVDVKKKREELGIPQDAILLLSVGELNENKNHQIVIKALAKLNNSNIHYAVAGEGILHKYLEDLANDLGISKQVHLLGFRKDVNELYKTANIYVLPSLREGLNVSLMEALAGGLTSVASNIRGNVDLIANEDFLFYPNDIASLEKVITSVISQKKSNAVCHTVDNLDKRTVNSMMIKIYDNIIR